MMLQIFNCSPSLIYGNMRQQQQDGEEEVEPQSQGDANSSRQKIGSSIAAWFHLLKATADCMPDEGWYQLNIPLRSMVYANYNEDAAEPGSTFHHCKAKSHFYKIWKHNFSEIRLRKHCRFAKCDFCVEWRRISTNWQRKGEAQEKLRLHRAWANVRERGLWHTKRDAAIAHPKDYISLSIDGMCAFVCCVCFLRMYASFSGFWLVFNC